MSKSELARYPYRTYGIEDPVNIPTPVAGSYALFMDLTNGDALSIKDSADAVVAVGAAGFAPDPSGEADGRMLDVQSGAYAFRDVPAGGGGSAQIPVEVVGGAYSPSQNTWQPVHVSDLDLLIAAVAGDTLLVTLNWHGSGNESTHIYGDFNTIVAGSPVTRISGRSDGLPGALLGYQVYSSGAAMLGYVAQPGDIDGANVLLRLYANAVHNTARAISGIRVSVENRGQ